MQNQIPQIHFKNGWVYQPITDEYAEKACEVVAKSFSSSNPLAIALGKTYEEEKQRFMKNIKYSQRNPLSHVILDGDQIVAVNLCSKFKESYLSVVMEDNFEQILKEGNYTDKQKFVLSIVHKIYDKNLIKDYDYQFQIYAKNPEYPKKVDTIPIYLSVMHYISCYYGGIEELGFFTHELAKQYAIKAQGGRLISQIDPYELEFQGKKVFEGIQHSSLSFVIHGCKEDKYLNPKFSYLIPQVMNYCQQLNKTLKQQYNTDPVMKARADNKLKEYMAIARKYNQEIKDRQTQLKTNTNYGIRPSL